MNGFPELQLGRGQWNHFVSGPCICSHVVADIPSMIVSTVGSVVIVVVVATSASIIVTSNDVALSSTNDAPGKERSCGEIRRLMP